MAVAHDEVAALDQQKAEIAGQIGLFEIGLAPGARRQDADARPGALRAVAQAGAKFAEERRQPLDVHLAVKARKGLRNDEAVLERIAGARGRLRAVAEHPPAPVGTAADVGGIEAQPAPAGRRDAAHRGEEIGRAGDGRGGQQALPHQRALAVDIGQDALE